MPKSQVQHVQVASTLCLNHWLRSRSQSPAAATVTWWWCLALCLNHPSADPWGWLALQLFRQQKPHFPSFTSAVTRSADTPVPSWTVVECWSLLTSTAFAKLLGMELEDLLASSVFRNRQTTAQSSILDVGNRVRQARWADSTRKRAAEARDVARLTIETTSSFDRTSHT